MNELKLVIFCCPTDRVWKKHDARVISSKLLRIDHLSQQRELLHNKPWKYIYKMEGIQRKALIIMVGPFFSPALHTRWPLTAWASLVNFRLLLSMKRQFSICPWDEALIPWRIQYNIVILFSCQAQRESGNYNKSNWRHSFAQLFFLMSSTWLFTKK